LNNISCVFNNKGYITSSNSTIIEIFKKDLIIQVNITQIINDLLINVTANETINQNIIININDKNYTAKLENGKFTGRLYDLENGNYTIKVFLEDTSIYEPNIIHPQVFNIDFIKTSIISYNMVTSDFTGEEFTIQLIDEDKNPLSNKTIIFKLNNENYTTTTDFNGTASVKINLTNGVYIITTIFQGDENYTDTTVNNIINVRLKTEINLTYTKYQNTVVLNVTLSKPITDNANILINNESGEFKIINGKTSLNITFFENNNYNITVYLNDNYYDCTPSKINFTVNVKHTQITAYNVTVNDEGDYYNITLKDEDGNLLSNKTLIITLNNTTYNKTTVNGTVTLPINLKRGLYPIIINYTGEDNYFSSYVNAEIYSKTNIDCEIKTQTLLYTAILNITFSKPVNKIRVQVGDKVYSKLLNQGKTQFNINNLSNGVYNITVKIVDEGYNFTQASSNFTINVIKTQLIADNFTTTDNIINNYTVTLTDENNNTLSDKQIQIILNNNTYSKYTDNNGQVSIPINLTNGDYPIKVIYSNITDKYDTAVITRNIHVKMNINVNMSFKRIFNNINLNLTFTKPINDTGIITMGDNSYVIEIINGTASLTLNNLSNGNYTIQLNLNESVYDFNGLTFNFTINIKHTYVNAFNKTIYYQSGSGFKIFLFDEDNNPLKDKYLQLTSGDITYLEKTDENACIEIIPYDLNIGVYDFEILFNGDNDYYSSQNKSRITILSSISLAEINNYTLNSTYTVKLYGDGPLVNCPVNISINGVNYTLTTDGEGCVKLNIGFDVGSYIINIVNPQTGEYKNQTINVLPRLSENTNIIMYYGANKYYTVKVFDDYGQTSPEGVSVNFKLNGVSYNMKTNNEGYASLKIMLNPGTYTVTAEYNGFSVSNNIIVKSTLITKDKTVKKAKKFKYAAKLIDSKGKVLKGKKITFKFKGKKYKAKTNKKGKAKVTVKNNKKTGKFTMLVSYKKLQVKNIITVKK